ncbi:hypothetical protein K6R49_003736 [Escherichia coli]|nr:hypothetical protein [Escherichia coli]MBJ0329704.1 hypothetical protein [Escherichia coli]
MISYQTVPYNVTATRANLDNAYADVIQKLLNQLGEREDDLSEALNKKPLEKLEKIQIRKDAYIHHNSKRVESYPSNTDDVFNKMYADGYELANVKTYGHVTVSKWIPRELDYTQVCNAFEEEFESYFAARIATLEEGVAKAKGKIQELVEWYRAEHQVIIAPLFFEPSGYTRPKKK